MSASRARIVKTPSQHPGIKRHAKSSKAPTPSASTETTTIATWIRKAVRRLSRSDATGKLFFGHGALNAVDEAAWIAAHSCRLSPLRLEAHLARPMAATEIRRADSVIANRIADRIPLAYLLGEAWLDGFRFKVDTRVIVPRSLIVECLREQFSPWIADSHGLGRVLDLCTGSGCLAILAARTFPNTRVDAVDISVDALEVARQNIVLHRMNNRVRAVRSDLFEGLGSRRYDLIISNPPYVDAKSMRALPSEYRLEPELALAGGRDGLDLIRRILIEARRHLKPAGLLVMEIGHNRRVLERAFPRVPFVWLETSAGPDKIFILPAEDLPLTEITG